MQAGLNTVKYRIWRFNPLLEIFALGLMAFAIASPYLIMMFGTHRFITEFYVWDTFVLATYAATWVALIALGAICNELSRVTSAIVAFFLRLLWVVGLFLIVPTVIFLPMMALSAGAGINWNTWMLPTMFIFAPAIVSAIVRKFVLDEMGQSI